LIQLSDGEFHTGTSLAALLGISRAAVWKHIQQLRQHGLAIESRHGKGYRLSRAIEFLQRDRIFQSMSADVASQVELEVLSLVSSTNDRLRKLLASGLSSGQVCLAERQTAGRGRQGRQWHSPLAANLYLSFYWRFSLSPVEMGGLSLALAVSVVERLSGAGISGLSIKWPNDIYLGDGKVGGILIDIIGESNGPCDLIIGIGLNYNMPLAVRDAIDQRVADLTDDRKGLLIGRNQLAAIVIEALFEGCSKFGSQGFACFHELWSKWDRVRDRPICLTFGERVIEGIALGVDEKGAVCLSTQSGRRCFASGELSLRERTEMND
jgi:BirA family biotin operon repressor/biotin-[acetyl-CoA-carboxylase] ligase